MSGPTDHTGRPHLTILGGGVAGLAVGHYARHGGLPFTIIESAPATGGICRTVRHRGFAFDLGAHRFHDKDPEITRDVLSLMDGRIQRISLGSHIWHGGRLIAFPPSGPDLVRALGLRTVIASVAGMIAARRKAVTGRLSFEDVAVRAYGRPLASMFLLNYSEKLWGAPCSTLSPLVSGGRLKGLNLRSAIADTVIGGARRAEHVDGSFYYPADGIGALADALAVSCGAQSIRTNTRVTRVVHDGSRVTAVEVDAGDRLLVDQLICTLPLPVLVRLLDPPLEGLAVPSLRFRTLRLVALFLNRASVTSSATIYFPDPAVPFTRVYEPRNRSSRMSPAGQTSLVAELPCTDGDPISELDDAAAMATVTAALEPTGWFRARDVLDAACVRVPAAYPVIDLEAEEGARLTRARLAGLTNLTLAGRAGRFEYAWIHNLLRHGRDLVSRMGQPADARR